MEIVRMSRKELVRSKFILEAVKGHITQKKASESLNISLRQVKRLCKRLKEEGIEGLAHRNRGKQSVKKVSSCTRAKVLELIKRDYSDFGPQLIKEQLEERNQISLSREWIRVFMIQEGLWKVNTRKNSPVHQRRTPRPREGELIQIDGSPEYWFEERGPKCCLINMVDDATSKIMACRFVKEESLEGYFQCLKQYLEDYGRPLTVYSDRHTIFKSPTAEEKPSQTQFGRAMKELGIELIYARSPQAKGRVERSHGTLQDRLIKIMRLDGISSIEEGNIYLEKFRNDYNRRFGKRARSDENAHRGLLPWQSPEKILCRKETRKVSKSLDIHYKHVIYQLLPKRDGRRLVGRTVLVSERQSGIVIEFENKEIQYKIFQQLPYQEKVMDRKSIDAFLDRKQPLTIIEKRRKGIAVNF